MIAPAQRALHVLLAAVPLAMVVVTCLDVLGRRFDRPLPGAIEIIELLMGLLVFGALPLVTAERGHVVVALFDEKLSARLLAWRNRGVALLSAVVLSIIAWRLFAKGIELAGFGDRSTYLSVPLAPMAFFMAAMSGLSVVALLREAFASAADPAIARGEIAS